MNTRALTGGRDRDKGWAQNEAGNWTPSVWDRRRVAVAGMNMVAEESAPEPLPEIVVLVILRSVSTGFEDFQAIAGNFNTWQEALRKA